MFLVPYFLKCGANNILIICKSKCLLFIVTTFSTILFRQSKLLGFNLNENDYINNCEARIYCKEFSDEEIVKVINCWFQTRWKDVNVFQCITMITVKFLFKRSSKKRLSQKMSTSKFMIFFFYKNEQYILHTQTDFDCKLVRYIIERLLEVEQQ